MGMETVEWGRGWPTIGVQIGNFPSIVESIPTQGSFTLEVRSLGKTRPNNIERDGVTRLM